VNWVFYRDIFGAWRWECTDAENDVRDSQHSYETREECVEAAGDAGMNAQLSAERSILCVQPNPDFKDTLEQALAAYRTVIACNANEAMHFLSTSVFDAYVLDYWLPDWSGIHLCCEIRRSDPNVPIGFYTAAGSEEHRKRAFKAGANAYVSAAAGPEALCDELRNLLRRTDVASVTARVNEYDAIQDELERRVVVAISRSENAREVAARATERSARVKAYRVFIDAGGTRADFDRWWPRVFAEASLDAGELKSRSTA
jgi:DNA-binding response OmpR family regulator